ncbi:hypothetical protein K505DRAFT_241199 [Melanomma pulvis-pyrius CBS 109.77]|uniref:Transcription factor domain-containing protein n=1 Tax=Melanomma pulvis-pyrius CBS 109.77 TaxID=1314802 RepID=A0A6A6XEY4_9PLEO|nr:hypothetical protein K505DRAFT_241199 [Melanomma pulvis-pyrius CBS 109.77]
MSHPEPWLVLLANPRLVTTAKDGAAHIQCSGYGKQTFFVNKTLADPSVSAPAVLAKRRLSRLKRPESRSIQDELDGLVELLKASTASPSHFRLEAFHLLQKLYLPQPEVTDDYPSHAAPETWFRAVCELEDPCPVLDYALIAFCTIQVYVTNTGSVSHDEGTERYNTTLGYLSTALNCKGDVGLNCILASIVVLSTCELFFFPTDDGLRVHIQGIADVLRLKPEFTDVSTTIWLRLWSRLRVISVLSQLTGRQQGSMSAAQWADLMPDKSNFDPMDQLMDIVCELPRTLDSATKIFPTEQSGDLEVEVAVTDLWSIMSDIHVWQVRLCAASPTPLYTAVTSKLDNPSDGAHDTKLFPFALEFQSSQTATHLVASWAFQLHIHTVLQRFLEERGENRTVPIQFIDLHNSFGNILREADKLARLLCQSIEYCHRIEMGTFGPQTMVYPQWIMRQFFARYGTEREVKWCNNIRNMSGIGTRCGIKLMVFQGSIK